MTNAMKLTTYSELETISAAFADGKMNLLIIFGRPGLAKSTVFRNCVPDDTCCIEGNASAYGMYAELAANRDKLVVIDDVDSLYADKAAIRLLKCLCQTDAKKRLTWYTRAAVDDGLPKEFETKSKVCIIANEWSDMNVNIKAVSDRGHLFAFDPSPEEVHCQVKTWCTDFEVYDWIGEHLFLFPELSMRVYRKAEELKSAGLDWRQFLDVQSETRLRLIVELSRDATFKSERERVDAFIDRTGNCRATYFNLKKKLPCVQSKTA